VETSLVATLALAFGLGLLHALDADHVVAVSALASRRQGRLEAILLCAQWALGHAVSLLALGAVVLFFGARLPSWLGDRAEQLVGLALVLLGGWVLCDVSYRRLHAHAHAHDGLPPHLHWHSHTTSRSTDGPHRQQPHRHDHGAVLVGVLHGAAGSAPALALMPLAKLASPLLALAYLLLFSLGVLVSMALCGGLIGLCFERLRGRGPAVLAAARGAVGLGAVACGAVLLA
jgi:ABC-type nickel/cobalt efflux system permease component RcnA